MRARIGQIMVTIRLEFKPRHMWIGVACQEEALPVALDVDRETVCDAPRRHVRICLVPTLSIHILWHRHEWRPRFGSCPECGEPRSVRGLCINPDCPADWATKTCPECEELKSVSGFCLNRGCRVDQVTRVKS